MFAATPAVITVLAAWHVFPAAAFFRLGTSVLVQERADPIVASGRASSHVHTIMGGNGFGTSVTYESLLASTCTSTGVQEDKSAYWTPIVYFWHKDGRFIAPKIENQGLTVYYGYNVAEGAVPFPEGFRMVAGQPLARSWNPPPNAKQYTFYECLGDRITNVNMNDFPKQICPFSVRMNVFFPRCGDLRPWSDDRSHVVYQVDGKCPASHPHLYPELHYELWYENKEDPQLGIIWDDGMIPDQPFVLSNGDPTGYGAHGDFFNGWETQALASSLQNCNGGGGDGRTEICPHLTSINARDCKKEGNSPDLGNNEQVSGWLPKLPGCVPITNTDAEAAAAPKTGCGNDGDVPASPNPAPPTNPSPSASAPALVPGDTSERQSSTASDQVAAPSQDDGGEPELGSSTVVNPAVPTSPVDSGNDKPASQLPSSTKGQPFIGTSLADIASSKKAKKPKSTASEQTILPVKTGVAGGKACRKREHRKRLDSPARQRLR